MSTGVCPIAFVEDMYIYSFALLRQGLAGSPGWPGTQNVDQVSLKLK